MARVLCFGLLAVLLAAEAAPARADVAPPPFRTKRPEPATAGAVAGTEPAPQTKPELQQGAIDPVSGRPYPPPLQPNPPKRTGPFRSCGSGMGAGLAGIGLAWGALWLGNRIARSQRPPSARG